jgi:phenylpropionate dioxygenase-like ring-hydroxylating dioxygenase large terminal subunit
VTTHRWAEAYPELGTEPIDLSSCVDDDVFQREIDKVFTKTWLMVGREEELPKPGDYKVRRLAFADTSAIMIRGKDDKIRAFHNICSHRGNKIVVERGVETYGGRRSGILSCRFHGWGFDSTGGLVHVPAEKKFYDCFDRTENGLAPIHCDVWAGFVFINLAEKPAETLKEFLAEIGDIFGEFPFNAMPKRFAYSTELNCNWKIAVDAFAEAYHVDTIHGGTFPGAKSSFEDVRLFDKHRIAALCADFTLPPTPAAALSQKFIKASVTDTKKQTGLPKLMNPGRRNNFINELSVIFPSLLMHVTTDIWFTHQFWPVSTDKTRWEGYYYLKEPKTHSEKWAIEHAQILQRNAWLEDTATMEATHQAIRSKAKRQFHLQDEEVLVRHGYTVLEKFLKS